MLSRTLPLLALLSLPVQPITTPDSQATPLGGRGVSKARCAARINARLEAMHRRDGDSASRAALDLDGYSLHHALQHRGYDMYVTGMRVRVPARHGWFRVDRCSYEPGNHTLEARLTFKDMAVSGLVRLYDGDLLGQDNAPRPLNACNMTLRFRKAGVGLTATAVKSARSPLEIATRADFLEPNFVSVHGLGCSERDSTRQAPTIEHRVDQRDLDQRESNDQAARRNDHLDQGTRRNDHLDQGTRRIFDQRAQRTGTGWGWPGRKRRDVGSRDRLTRREDSSHRDVQDRDRDSLRKLEARNEDSNSSDSLSRGRDSLRRPGANDGSSRVLLVRYSSDSLKRHGDKDGLARGGYGLRRLVGDGGVGGGETNREDDEEPRWVEGKDLAAEVEDVFLRGVKSLLTSYMDKQLQPALSETLMASMGYTVSYG